MKIKVASKVIDLSLVEEMSLEGNIFNILYNNGRVVSFFPKKAKKKVLFTGDGRDVQTFMVSEIENSMGDITYDNIKEQYQAAKTAFERGKQMFEVYNLKDYNREIEAENEALKNLFVEVRLHWKEYIDKHVTTL